MLGQAIFLVLIGLQRLQSEFIGNALPDEGEIWSGPPKTLYVMNNNESRIPYDGYITAYVAQITRPDIKFAFQVWRQETSSQNVTLIGESLVTTTDSSTLEKSETFYLKQPKKVKAGDQLGFWTPSHVPIARYQTDRLIEDAILVKSDVTPQVGHNYLAESHSSHFRLALGALLETHDIQVQRSAMTTQSSIQLATVYGRPELKGSKWTETEIFSLFSIIIEFTKPTQQGFLNQIQIFSVEANVKVEFQLWRRVNDDIVGEGFLLVDKMPYITKQSGSFENTTFWNTRLSNGDLFGVSVTDSNTKGFPIGWQRVSGAGDTVYQRINAMDLPVLGHIYSDYQKIGNSHQLAIAVFASSELKEDDEGTDATVSVATTVEDITSTRLSTPPDEGTTVAMSSGEVLDEIVVGHRDIVFSSSVKEELLPFAAITILLPAIFMPMDGKLYEVGFDARATLPIEIGIYRQESAECDSDRCYRKIFSILTTPSAVGPFVLHLAEPVTVKKGDVLGFYNKNRFSLVIGRVGVGGIGDNPFIYLGKTGFDQVISYTRYIKGYEYAIYAIMAKGISSLTTSAIHQTEDQTAVTAIPSNTAAVSESTKATMPESISTSAITLTAADQTNSKSTSATNSKLQTASTTTLKPTSETAVLTTSRAATDKVTPEHQTFFTVANTSPDSLTSKFKTMTTASKLTTDGTASKSTAATTLFTVATTSTTPNLITSKTAPNLATDGTTLLPTNDGSTPMMTVVAAMSTMTTGTKTSILITADTTLKPTSDGATVTLTTDGTMSKQAAATTTTEMTTNTTFSNLLTSEITAKPTTARTTTPLTTAEKRSKQTSGTTPPKLTITVATTKQTLATTMPEVATITTTSKFTAATTAPARTKTTITATKGTMAATTPVLPTTVITHEPSASTNTPELKTQMTTPTLAMATTTPKVTTTITTPKLTTLGTTLKLKTTATSPKATMAATVQELTSTKLTTTTTTPKPTTSKTTPRKATPPTTTSFVPVNPNPFPKPSLTARPELTTAKQGQVTEKESQTSGAGTPYFFSILVLLTLFLML